MTLRVACLQIRHDGDLDANLDRVVDAVDDAAQADAHIAVLPEYVFGPTDDPPDEVASRVRGVLEDATADRDVAVAGNVLEPAGDGLRNVGVVYQDGELLLEQPKIHPMDHERDRGIQPGDAVDVAEVHGVTVGVVVCADILFPEIPLALADRGAEILLNPVMSPYRSDDPTRDARESMYVARAYDTSAVVAKAGGIRAGDAVGRSLVAAPWGLLARYDDERSKEILIADIDLDKLGRIRDDRRRFPKRRRDVYRRLID